ncbi:MAG: gliding motility-associated ABC transporter substrate-binding protein GldG [Bacteroidota bacterium]
MGKSVPYILKTVATVLLLNLLAQLFYVRLDLTEDLRYTLSKAAINSVAPFKTPVIIDVLLEGTLTPEFLKLKKETQALLEEFAEENDNIKFNFVNPLEGERIENVLTDLQSIGLTPTRVTTEENTTVSQDIVFPWAMVNQGNRTIKVPLLRNTLGASMEDRVNNSVQHLEYAFANAFTKLGLKEKKRIAVIKGNGELDDIYMADFLTSLREYYNIGAITLDSIATNAQGTLKQLQKYDLALIAKPTEPFSDSEKYIMDQFITQGGKSVWLIDQVQMELDSLFNETGTALALPRDLNLGDFFFTHGLRINPVLVSDLYFTQIVLASGKGNSAQYNPVPWFYNPMVFSRDDHPINRNLEALRFQFANAIDTLASPLKKTILYQSSPLSKLEGTPKQIALELVNRAPDKETFNNGNQFLAVLLEGQFKSAFTKRVKPVDLQQENASEKETKMLVVSDGDIVKNQLRNGTPLELGYDKWTNSFYGNKEFLINAVNYMLDNTGLINIRNKNVAIPILDEQRIATEKTRWQVLNIALPLGLVLVFVPLINLWRKRRYR